MTQIRYFLGADVKAGNQGVYQSENVPGAPDLIAGPDVSARRRRLNL